MSFKVFVSHPPLFAIFSFTPSFCCIGRNSPPFCDIALLCTLSLLYSLSIANAWFIIDIQKAFIYVCLQMFQGLSEPPASARFLLKGSNPPKEGATNPSEAESPVKRPLPLIPRNRLLPSDHMSSWAHSSFARGSPTGPQLCLVFVMFWNILKNYPLFIWNSDLTGHPVFYLSTLLPRHRELN